MLKHTQKIQFFIYTALSCFSVLHAQDPKSLSEISAKAVLKNILSNIKKPSTDEEWQSLSQKMTEQIHLLPIPPFAKEHLQQQIQIQHVSSTQADIVFLVMGSNGFLLNTYNLKPPMMRQIPVPNGMPIQSIHPSNKYLVVITKDGKAFLFKNKVDDVGQLDFDLSSPICIELPQNVTQSVVSGSHGLLLTSDGTVFALGDNRFGALGVGNQDECNIPTRVFPPHHKRVVQVATSYANSLFLTIDGEVLSSGMNVCSSLGIQGQKESSIPMQIPLNTPIVQITSDGLSSLLLTKEGQVLGFGNNQNGQIGFTNANQYHVPTKIPLPTQERIAQISHNVRHSLLRTEQGHVFGFGDNTDGQLGFSDKNNRCLSTQALLPEDAHATNIIATDRHSFILTKEGRIFVFGPDRNCIECLIGKLLWGFLHGEQ